MHGVQIKGIEIMGNIDAKFGGVTSPAKPREFKWKSLKKVSNCIPLSMSYLTSKVFEHLGDGEAEKEPEVTHDTSSFTNNIYPIEGPHDNV